MPEIPEIHHVTREVDETKTRLAKVESNVAVLTTEVGNLGDALDSGVKDLKSLIKDQNNRPTSFSPATIYTAISLLAIGVTAFWGAIGLLYTPLKEDAVSKSTKIDKLVESSFHLSNSISLIDERSQENKRDLVAGLSRVDSESAKRHVEQQAAIDSIQDDVEKLKEQRVIDADAFGALRATDKWLRDDVEAVKDDIQRHEDKYHP